MKSDPRQYWWLARSYILLLCVTVAILLLRWPIIASDTDLWHHLLQGGYIVEHLRIPSHSFYSFLSPPREFVNYSWLFQLTVYAVHRVMGYPGLILLRALLFLATLWMLWKLLAPSPQSDASPLFSVALFALYAALLLPRFELLRPHNATYLLLITSLFFYERAPQRALIWLPVLSVLWCNIHGIEYPVMLLIHLVYTVERLVRRRIQSLEARQSMTQQLLIVLLSVCAVYATPHGARLVPVPFSPTISYSSDYTIELRRVIPEELLTLHLTFPQGPDQSTLFVIILLWGMAAAVSAWQRRSLRIIHTLFYVCGVLLLSKGQRFIYECALLALPLISANLPRHSVSLQREIPVGRVLASLALALPFATFSRALGNAPQWPVSAQGLPQGTVAFLRSVSAKGSVLNAPGTGGYLAWAIYPNCRVFMDMNFLFKQEDFFTAFHAFSHAEILSRIQAEYDPSFIAAPLTAKGFPQVIGKFPQYTLVFFDDTVALYVNAKHYPELSRSFAISMLDPFTLKEAGVGVFLYLLKPEEVNAALHEARRLLTVYPDGLLLNQLVAVVYNEEGAFDRALPFGEAVIHAFPESRTGYGLKGDSLQGLGFYEKAIEAYRLAAKRSSPNSSAEVYNQMGKALFKLGRYRAAYGALRKAIKPFSPRTTYEDLYALGSAALRAGRAREAAMILRFASRKPPSENVTLSQHGKEIGQMIQDIPYE